ncbi:MAG: hypothetical protein PVF79_12900 [Desulfobacterales bacterium]|jgi:hypothetical protein
MIRDEALVVYRKLEREFQATELHRSMHIEQYEADTELEYDIIAVTGNNRGKVRLRIEKFVGGGFAGQVYRVKILDLETDNGPIGDLAEGGIFAMKILIPPSAFSRLFRNVLYWVGFQGPFQLQVNPDAARSGAIWQKFIRRGAKVRFHSERGVVDIHAIFEDSTLGSCGELSEWVDGRTWRLEVDDRLDLLKHWIKGKKVDERLLGSPEYRAKRTFMHDFVKLLHQMGAHEFARQYEWTTWKSQPNCLKRTPAEDNSSDGLVAVDFRAGLALLPFLPMSPGDIKLIAQGLRRGSLVQFDRGDIGKLEQFVATHHDAFSDMHHLLEELKSAEQVYRNSVPDISHNHLRLFFSRRLWSTMLRSAVNGWKIRNLIDAHWHRRLQTNVVLTLIFGLLGFIPLLGRFIRRIWGQTSWRRHYKAMLTRSGYLSKALHAKIIENIIAWHRAGRLGNEKALNLSQRIWPCVVHLPLSLLPAGIHKFMTDWQHAKERLNYYLLRPVRLYFNNELREQWLREMVTEGQEKHLLGDEDADVILSQIKEPFIQKYLKSLAVHLCTLPVTQVVSVMVAIVYVVMHPEMPRAQAYGIGLGIIALFQVVPISPGSLVRGLYVVFLVIRERNFKDYNIAVFLGFFKYIGYLAFPIQMTYRYPALARFMAGHWATEAVHAVPVFGERGALLEHSVFNLFYNWPLTIRRRMRKRSEWRTALPTRYWHIVMCVIVATGIFVLAEGLYYSKVGQLPSMRAMWSLVVFLPLVSGAVVTLGAGGATLWKRLIGAIGCATAVGVFYTVLSPMFGHGQAIEISAILINCVWRVFVFTILSVIGVLLTELMLPEPETDYSEEKDEKISTG